MEEINAVVEQEYQEMWNNWIIFQKFDTTNDILQIKKQIGLVDDKVDFSVRQSIMQPPNLQEIYEGIINGIIKRRELGLYQNAFTYYCELQTALNEFLKMYGTSLKKEVILDLFQNLTGLSLTKENVPKIVVRCNNCNSYVYYTNNCNKCRNAFYCDQSCVKADLTIHCKKCIHDLPMTPQLFSPLIVELHSGTDMKHNITLYYEHEMKFSQKIRGMQLFMHLSKFFLKHRWLKGNKYSVEESEQSVIRFIYHADNLNNSGGAIDEEEEYKVQQTPHNPTKYQPVPQPFHTSSRHSKQDSINQSQLSQNDVSMRSKTDDNNDESSEDQESDDAMREFYKQQRSEKTQQEKEIKDEFYAKLPIIQEIKVVFLNFGALITDILQEQHTSYKRYIHIFRFPY
ncbi:UNKNOWN [Stylonychia lemnae]|uniref:MYND-type domain-containing protein n=1 Tax=Stylonychia lemnae TaxID=5949 RepID=A0A078A204_STYLE|nr:UNKNOWN [Stylonychia lemnae]|eukprot:CDW75832.1 UNKNOWN [Stylonychia lemnae]